MAKEIWKIGHNGTSAKIFANHAVHDASGRNIYNTYATKDSLSGETDRAISAENNISETLKTKLDTSSFSDVSGTFLTAHQSLNDYYKKTETSGKDELLSEFNTKQDVLSFEYNEDKIISINNSAISAGFTYEAGNNITIDGNIINSKDWTNEITVKFDTSAMTAYYTSAQVEERLSNFGGFEVVQGDAAGKPDVLGPSTKIIYLVKMTGISPDAYKEWIYTASNTWEMIGDTTIDLSNYYIKSETSGANELSNKFDTKQDVLSAGKNIDITNNTVSVTDTVGLLFDDTLTVKNQNNNKILGVNTNILTNVKQNDKKTDDIVLTSEEQYLKIEATDENENKIYGGIIGNHNIKPTNAGKILRINGEGTDLELAAQSTGSLAYNIIDSSEFQHEQNVNVLLNAFNDCGTIPNITKHLNFFFEKPLEPDVMPRGMIHFELPFDTELLDVNVYYRLNDEEYMECNYSFLNEKDTKVPIYFKPNHIYQISLTNHNAAFFDFSDNLNEKKNFIQLWYLDSNSKLLHHFPIIGSEETEIKNGSPYDEAGFSNIINQIDRNNIFEYAQIFKTPDNMGFSNVINEIKVIPIFEYKFINENTPDEMGFNNFINTINRKDIYQYYSKSNDTYSIANKLIDCQKTEKFNYTKEVITDNCSFGNKLVGLNIRQIELEGYTREG